VSMSLTFNRVVGTSWLWIVSGTGWEMLWCFYSVWDCMGTIPAEASAKNTSMNRPVNRHWGNLLWDVLAFFARNKLLGVVLEIVAAKN